MFIEHDEKSFARPPASTKDSPPPNKPLKLTRPSVAPSTFGTLWHQSKRLQPPGHRAGQLSREPLGVRMRSILAVIMLVLLCSPDTEAETFETNHDFSVVLPAGWVEAPSDALRHIESGISELSGGANKQRYDYGYQLSSANTWFEYPYILVQVNTNGRVAEGQLTQYEKIESGLRSGVEKAEESFGAVLSSIKQGETLYDEREHLLWSTFTTNVQGLGAVNGLIAVKLTEFGFIQLMGYSTEDTYEKYSPIFRQAVQTLLIPDEYQYRPRLTDHAPTIWGINLGQSAIAGLVGGLVGGVVALIGYLKKKRSRRDA